MNDAVEDPLRSGAVAVAESDEVTVKEILLSSLPPAPPEDSRPATPPCERSGAMALSDLILNTISRGDLEEISRLQISTQDRLSLSRRKLETAISLAEDNYQRTQQRFLEHVHLLAVLKADLHSLHSRVKGSREMLARAFPGRLPRQTEDDDD